MKKVLYILFLLCIMLGCSKKEKELVIIENTLYSPPVTQNDLTITLYNELSAAIEENDEMEIVKSIAKTFAADFFTLKDKASDESLGGTTYFLKEKRMAAKLYLQFYYYKNMNPIKNQYGEDNLPEVSDLIVVDPIPTTFDEKDYGTLDAYNVRLDIKYKETTIPTSALKTETVITVAKYPDAYYIVEIK